MRFFNQIKKAGKSWENDIIRRQKNYHCLKGVFIECLPLKMLSQSPHYCFLIKVFQFQIAKNLLRSSIVQTFRMVKLTDHTKFRTLEASGYFYNMKTLEYKIFGVERVKINLLAALSIVFFFAVISLNRTVSSSIKTS